MIVKNESKVIARALNSVREIIDYYVVIDTGSADNTPGLVVDLLYNIPGRLLHIPFENFAKNRSDYLRIAREFSECDYSLVLDADEVVELNGWDPGKLTEDMYLVRYTGDLDYSYPIIFSNKKKFRYEYVTHEIPVCDEKYSQAELGEMLKINHLHDGGSVHEKYERDIRLIKEALKTSPEDPRYWFYLANSYRDIDKKQEAIDAYLRRASLGGWDQEVFVSYYRAALLYLDAGYGDLFVEHMEKAICAIPTRMDAYYELGRYYNNKKLYYLAEACLCTALALGYPDNPLFFYRPIYDYLAYIETGVCAYYVGKHDLAISLNNKVIENPKAPKDIKDLAITNRAFSEPFVK